MSELPATEKRDRVLKSAFQYREALLAQALGMLRDWAAAEDVVQDAFLVIMNKSDSFEEGTSIYAWARQIVRNKALEACRRRGRENSGEDEAMESSVAAALEDFLTEQKAEGMRDKCQVLKDCMSGLRDRILDLLVGFYWRMESCEELARLHRRSVNSVRLILTRTRQELKNCMDRKLKTLATGP